MDATVSPLELLAELAPETALRRVGHGYLGWCPFHDDRASDALGQPGTPSFYVVFNRGLQPALRLELALPLQQLHAFGRANAP